MSMVPSGMNLRPINVPLCHKKFGTGNPYTECSKLFENKRVNNCKPDPAVKVSVYTI